MKRQLKMMYYSGFSRTCINKCACVHVCGVCMCMYIQIQTESKRMNISSRDSGEYAGQPTSKLEKQESIAVQVQRQSDGSNLSPRGKWVFISSPLTDCVSSTVIIMESYLLYSKFIHLNVISILKIPSQKYVECCLNIGYHSLAKLTHKLIS